MKRYATSQQVRPADADSPRAAGRLAGVTGLDPAEVHGSHSSPVRWIALIAAAGFALEMAISTRYGYHRDELYFLVAGQHPAFGYVDQPPLTPLLARLSAVLSGNSLIALRAIPALALAALVVLSAAMARQLGAGRTGQILAALATVTCAEYVGSMHLLTTTAPDMVAWSLLMFLVLRLLATGDRRLWLAIGLCVGVAMEAKWNIAFLVFALAVGFACSPPARRLARGWYLPAGCLLAAVIAAPDLIWQAMHGWPSFDVFRALQGSAWHNRAVYWPAQLLYTGLALCPLWIAGLAWSLRRAEARWCRAVSIGCAVTLGLLFVLGGKAYYPGAVFTYLFAAGSIPLERWIAGFRARAGLAGALMVVSGLVSLPVAVPVLPATVLHSVPLQKINYDLAETIAWPREVGLVAAEYRALPAAQRRHTAILAGNYGEAGAIDRFGPGLGLPPAYSGANNFWLWGPPPAADNTVIAINVSARLLHREFRHVRQIAVFFNGIGVSNDEQGAVLYLATGQRTGWSAAWPMFKNYS